MTEVIKAHMGCQIHWVALTIMHAQAWGRHNEPHGCDLDAGGVAALVL